MNNRSDLGSGARKPDEPRGNAGPQADLIARSNAVRQALAAGFDDPRQGTAYILKELGIEVSLSHFSAVVATERKKGWTKKGKPGRRPKASNRPSEGGLTLGAPADEDDETDPDEAP